MVYRNITLICLIFFLALPLCSAASSEADDRVLLTIDNRPVYLDDFVYIYEKNKNIGETPLSVNDYLDLFIVYQLKLAEAYGCGIDTIPSVVSEFETFRFQLSASDGFDQRLFSEYCDGIMLFEISNRCVWQRAVDDKGGLENFFKENRSKYVWNEPHFKGYVVYAMDDSIASEAFDFLNSQEIADSELAGSLQKKFGKKVRLDHIVAARGENPVSDAIAFGGEKVIAYRPFASYFPYRTRIIEQPETAADVRGAVLTDYQDYLERVWVENLRVAHRVDVNKKVLEKLKQ